MNNKHGHTKKGWASPTYLSWKSMKQRCQNKDATAFHRYGGKGVRICKRWGEFTGFLDDMGIRPEGKTLDRIDNTKSYYPENCKWSTHREQANNRLDNSKFAGVRFYKRLNKWQATAPFVDGKKQHLGVHSTLFYAVFARWLWEDNHAS